MILRDHVKEGFKALISVEPKYISRFGANIGSTSGNTHAAGKECNEFKVQNKYTGIKKTPT